MLLIITRLQGCWARGRRRAVTANARREVEERQCMAGESQGITAWQEVRSLGLFQGMRAMGSRVTGDVPSLHNVCFIIFESYLVL